MWDREIPGPDTRELAAKLWFKFFHLGDFVRVPHRPAELPKDYLGFSREELGKEIFVKKLKGTRKWGHS